MAKVTVYTATVDADLMVVGQREDEFEIRDGEDSGPVLTSYSLSKLGFIGEGDDVIEHAYASSPLSITDAIIYARQRMAQEKGYQ